MRVLRLELVSAMLAHHWMRLVKLSQLIWLQLLPGDLQLGLEVLLEQLRESAHENEFIFPQLHKALQHIDDVVVVNLRAKSKPNVSLECSNTWR